MSLAELAKRHREKGGNRDSGSRLTLGGDTKKKESSGALSLSDLLNKKKNNPVAKGHAAEFRAERGKTIVHAE